MANPEKASMRPKNAFLFCSLSTWAATERAFILLDGGRIVPIGADLASGADAKVGERVRETVRAAVRARAIQDEEAALHPGIPADSAV